MGKAQPLPILITGGGRRIGLALAWHFINQKQPVIISYRTHYPAIDGLINAGAQCIQADFSTNDGVMAFADEVLKSTHGLRAILHNASAWMAEKPGTPLTDVLACMMQIHVNTPIPTQPCTGKITAWARTRRQRYHSLYRLCGGAR